MDKPIFALDAIETSKFCPIDPKACKSFDRHFQDIFGSPLGSNQDVIVLNLANVEGYADISPFVRDVVAWISGHVCALKSTRENATKRFAWQLRQVDQLLNLYVCKL